jgi:hypothetical protein
MTSKENLIENLHEWISGIHSVLALCKNWPKIGICDFSNFMVKFIKVS